MQACVHKEHYSVEVGLIGIVQAVNNRQAIRSARYLDSMIKERVSRLESKRRAMSPCRVVHSSRVGLAALWPGYVKLDNNFEGNLLFARAAGA